MVCVSFFNIFHAFDQVKDNGLEDSVVTVEDIRSGIESRGTGKLSLINDLKLTFEFAITQFVNLSTRQKDPSDPLSAPSWLAFSVRHHLNIITI